MYFSITAIDVSKKKNKKGRKLRDKLAHWLQAKGCAIQIPSLTWHLFLEGLKQYPQIQILNLKTFETGVKLCILGHL